MMGWLAQTTLAKEDLACMFPESAMTATRAPMMLAVQLLDFVSFLQSFATMETIAQQTLASKDLVCMRQWLAARLLRAIQHPAIL